VLALTVSNQCVIHQAVIQRIGHSARLALELDQTLRRSLGNKLNQQFSGETHGE
jgi:hypothetical protein